MRTFDNKITQEPDKVWVSVTYTINLGNYENLKIDSGFSRSVKFTEIPSDLREEMIDELVEEVLTKGNRLKRKHSK